MQPYQQASKEILRQSKEPQRALKSLGNTALSAAGFASGGALLNRIGPLLSNLIPSDMAQKGLAKVDPRLGKFVSAAVGQGLPFEEVAKFIKEKTNPSQNKPEEKEQGISEFDKFTTQYPMLGEAILSSINRGNDPNTATQEVILKSSGASKNAQTLKKMIKQVEKDKGLEFVQFITKLLANHKGKEKSQAPQQTTQMQQKVPQAQQIAPGPGEQKLMALLQARNKPK